jgi:hypothetical protein
MGKAEETKSRLERAALTLFVARGVAETTTKEIAMAASVAEGTIYRYSRRSCAAIANGPIATGPCSPIIS